MAGWLDKAAWKMFGFCETTFGHTYPYKTGPGGMTISIPAKCFIKGKNIIKIIDNAQASDSIDNWIVLSSMKLNF